MHLCEHLARVPSEIELWLPCSLPWVGGRSAPSAIMQPGSVTTSTMRLGDQKLTFTPNQKVAPLRQAHRGLEEDWASSSFDSLSKLPIRTPPMVIGKMQFHRTLVIGLNTGLPDRTRRGQALREPVLPATGRPRPSGPLRTTRSLTVPPAMMSGWSAMHPLRCAW